MAAKLGGINGECREETKTGSLNLALDIDNSMGFNLGLLEQETRLARQKPRLAVLALIVEQMPCGVGHHELNSLCIRLKPKLFRYKSNLHIGFISVMVN